MFWISSPKVLTASSRKVILCEVNIGKYYSRLTNPVEITSLTLIPHLKVYGLEKYQEYQDV